MCALHQAWAAPIVFALCFAESLAFISLLIPAWAALVGIGAIISASDLNFWPIWIAGSLGAALGDWLSYWVGLKLENRVYHMWPLSQHPDLIPAGEAFIRKWGAFGIFIGRFSGPLRASVPLVAGMFAMPYWRFQIANFTSAFVWAAVLLTLGDVTSIDDQMARQADGRLKRICRGLRPGRAALQQRSSVYFSAATPACEITSSCEPLPPLAPIAPITLPPTTSGLPPREAITSSSVGR